MANVSNFNFQISIRVGFLVIEKSKTVSQPEIIFICYINISIFSYNNDIVP